MLFRQKINLISAGLSIFLLSFLLTTDVFSQPTKAKKGVIDLRKWDWAANQDIALKGEWEFYWEKIIFSNDTREFNTTVKDYISLPSTWNDYMINGKKIGPRGFATYRLKILLNDSVNSLAIRTRIISTAYDLYVNGIKILHSGMVGRTKDETIPEYHPEVASFNAIGEVELILHVSNFEHRVGGPRDIISLGIIGKDMSLFKSRSVELLLALFLAGCFFIMGLYHIVLFAIKRDRSPLFFSLFCIILMIRLFVTGDIPITSFFYVNWYMLIRVEYLSFYIGFILFFAFFSSLFKEKMNKRIVAAALLLLGLLILFVLVTPPTIFTSILIPTQIIILIITIYTFYVLYIAHKSGNKEAIIFFAGYLLLLTFIINDVLYADEIIETGHFFSFGLFLFLGFQSVLLSRRYSLTFKRNEDLVAQLDISNQDLEKKVAERTHSLEEQKEDLKHKNIKIKEQNKELHKLNNELDNFVYLVSHDLKAPLASILGLIQLSKSENDIQKLKNYQEMMERSLSRQNEFISEILDYTRNARLPLSHDQINFQELIESTFEKFQFIEQWKSIKNKISVDQSELFVTDRQRLSVLISNIISNALKYSTLGNNTPEVSIKVKTDSDNAQIEVIDNGCGIDPERIDKVFDMFYRANDNISGSGLGLYIVKETIEKLHGKINIESTVGEGTTVNIVVPNLNKEVHLPDP
ncbi:MAG: sensor histidine kinase [Bacteroidetes bacterium]|nr:sensor histidine kinase [Bacteroidota bacterium]